MVDFVLDVAERTIVGKNVKRLRAQGIVPVTVYGPKIKPASLQVPSRKLELTLREAGGTNLIQLQSEKETYTVITREVQRDVLKGSILHVDFFAVDEAATLIAEVPVIFIGESPAVESREGVLMTGLNTITIEALPSNLPHQIEIDISVLQTVGSAITVRDLDLGDNVTPMNDPDETLARIVHSAAARSEEAEEGEEQLGGGVEPEVITKGKEEDED